MLSDMAHNLDHLADAVMTVDSASEVTQQSFHSEITQPQPSLLSFLVADGDGKGFQMPSFLEKTSTAALEAAEKEAGFLTKTDLDEVKASINKLIFAVAATFSATVASWFDLKQGVAGLLNEEQERALPEFRVQSLY